MLYRPENFDPLTETPWHDEDVRARIQAVVDDARTTYSPDDFWPADEWDAYRSPLPLMNLYVGAAGVLWALHELARRNDADVDLDLAAAARRMVERWREQPDFMDDPDHPLPEPRESGFLAGGAGVVYVAWLLTGDGDLADDLLARVRANNHNEADEIMWGSPGTMVAARAMHESTGEDRWASAWREAAEALLARRDGDGLWSISLYGGTHRGTTPPHGLVGNVASLLRGGALLDDDVRQTLMRDTNDVLARIAFVEDGLANWPHPADRDQLEGRDGEIRLQWCVGSPGIVICTADYLDEELLLAGAELVWQAGPHGDEKGAGICHGTAGNGYALLKTFARTQDERWLDRARRFAVHALEQVERKEHGRYSLFTGDVGAALFAADCLAVRTAYPLLEATAAADS